MLAPLKRYWKLYGGWTAFRSSPYLFAAALFADLCFPLWLHPETSRWEDISITVLPSLMGFSIAAIAVMLAFSDSKSLRVVTQGGREDSYFLKTIANLTHFLVAQIVALLLAILGKGFHFKMLAFFGIFALVYAIGVSLAAAGQLMNAARIINKAASLPDNQPPPAEAPQTNDVHTHQPIPRRARL